MGMSVLLTSLRQAMLSERDGVQFYSMAAKQAEDSGAVALFEQLANEEMSHFNALQKEYQSVLDTSIGILLEKQSYEFYVRQAEVAEDANVKAFFHELAVWEEGHYQMLLKEDEALKEEYWSENRFAPLL